MLASRGCEKCCLGVHHQRREYMAVSTRATVVVVPPGLPRSESGFSGSFVSGLPTARLGSTLRRGHEGTEHLSTKGTWAPPLKFDLFKVCQYTLIGCLETIGEPAGAWLG